MKCNFLGILIFFALLLLLVDGKSYAEETSQFVKDVMNLMEGRETPDMCGDKPGKTISFKTQYESSDSQTGKFAEIFCASSPADCVDQLSRSLIDRKFYRVQNGEKIFYTAEEIKLISSDFCEKEFEKTE